MNRRTFIQASTIAGTAVTAVQPVAAASVAEAPKDVTQTLARHVVAARYEDLPERARHEAARSLVNWMAVAVGGCRHEAVEIALAAVKQFAGPPQATVLGRKERLDIMNAPLVNGISSHVFDFDDTDLTTTVHPSAPVIPVLLALAEQRKFSGQDFVNALVLGIEAECRIALAVTPGMQEMAWHPTGTVGGFGAAVAAGKILGLDAGRMSHAIGLAATQPVGIREMFGSMTKSFHPGRAAQNGLLAALLAEKGYTSSLQGIEARRGFASVVSKEPDYRIITDGLGAHYEIFRNSYKPFACGLVVHAVIDACIQLRDENKLTPAEIVRVDLTVNPIVFELTAKRKPQTGLEGKFSVFHAAAVALVTGRAGEAQFSDAQVRDKVVIGVRDKVEAVAEPSLLVDQARVKITLTDGRVLERSITHALGSVENPMTDAQLAAKFTDLTEAVLPKGHTRRLLDLCHDVERVKDMGDVGRAAAG